VVLLSRYQHFTMTLSAIAGLVVAIGITTLIDVLVVFLFTKPLVTLLARTRFYGGGHRWSGLDPPGAGACRRYLLRMCAVPGLA
jgi:preprotein translocase subunit SecD